MARIRTIKPEFWSDSKIGKLKRDERLLFIGMWNLADDKGVLPAGAGFIKGQLFPYDEDLRIANVESWIESLVKARMIVPFEYKEESYFVIRTFMDHQVINRPSKPKINEEHLSEIFKSLNIHGVVNDYSHLERKGTEGNGTETEAEGVVSVDVKFIVPQIISVYAEIFPEFIRDQKRDPRSAKSIFDILSHNARIEEVNHEQIMDVWQNICEGIRDKPAVQFYAGTGLSTIANSLPTIIQKIRNNGNRKTSNGSTTRPIVAAAEEVLRRTADQDPE